MLQGWVLGGATLNESWFNPSCRGNPATPFEVVVVFNDEIPEHKQKTEIEKDREPFLEIDGMDRGRTEGETGLQQLNG